MRIFIILLFFFPVVLPAQPGRIDWEPVRGPDYVTNFKVLGPDSSGTFFAYSYNALMSSSDKGRSWRFHHIFRYPITAWSVAPDGHYFVGDNHGFLYQSWDGGTSWTEIEVQRRGAKPIEAVVQDSQGVIYLVGHHPGAAGMPNGIYVSRDSGATWNRKGGYGVRDVSMLYLPPSKVLIGHNYGFHISEDGGETWTSYLDDTGRWARFAQCSDGSLMMVEGFQLYRSQDTGKTWTRDTRVPSVVELSGSGDTLYMVSHAFAAPSSVLYRSVNCGEEWEVVNDSIPNINSLYALSGDECLAGGYLYSPYRFEDGGATVATAREGISASHAEDIAVAADGTIILATPAHGLLYASDKNGPWQKAIAGTRYDWDSTDQYPVGFHALAVLPDGTLLAGAENGIHRSTDNGRVWERLPVSDTAVTQISVYSDGSIEASGDMDSLYVSSGDGSEWERRRGEVGEYLQVRTRDGGYIRTRGTRVWRSEDGGHPWKMIFEPDWAAQHLWNSDSLGLAFLVAATGERYDSDDGYWRYSSPSRIYISADQGRSWRRSDTGLDDDVVAVGHFVAPDGRVYIGANDSNTYRFNAETHEWERLTENSIPVVPICMALLPDGRLIAGTKGHGLYSSKQPAAVGRETLAGSSREQQPYATVSGPLEREGAVQLVMPHAGRVTVRMVDLLGRTCGTLLDGFRSRGRHTLMFDAAGDVPSGMYGIWVTTPESSRVTWIQVVR